MKYSFKTVTSINHSIAIDEETHTYLYTNSDGETLKSDASVTKLLYGDVDFSKIPNVAGAAASGTQSHAMLEQFVIEHGLDTTVRSVAEVADILFTCTNPIVQECLLKVISNFNEEDKIQILPEVKLFTQITNTNCKIRYVGGAIDLLVFVVNKEGIKKYIFDLKTAKRTSKHERQLAIYLRFIREADIHCEFAACLYAGEKQIKYAHISNNALEYALNRLFENEKKCTKPEMDIDSDLIGYLEIINQEYEEKKKELDIIQKNRDSLISQIIEPYKDKNDIVFKFKDKFRYSVYTVHRKAINEEIVSQKCPEAIKWQEFRASKLLTVRN